MIGQRYQQKKQAVLDICSRYLRFRGNTDDGVDVDFLKRRIQDVKNNRYVLAVVGEVKAGKSTLINALLGESILPTDCLQSSSAVIEIFQSKKKFLKVRYADGHIERTENNPNTPEDEAFQKLQQVGAIQESYRDIPTTLIDAGIIKECIKPDKQLPIDELEKKSKMDLRDKEKLIQQYVKDRTLKDIPKEITFGFPLEYAFDGLRLVDSPGVNAHGGVENVTYRYIRQPNALLFAQSIQDSVESSSFNEFVRDALPELTRDTLFLVLTKSGLQSEIEIEEKVQEVRDQYRSDEFHEDRILHVDSMLKIVSDEIEKFDSVASLKQYYLKKEKHFEEKYRSKKRPEWRKEAINFDTKLKLLNNVLEDIGDDADRGTVKAALQKSSNFDKLELVIDEFSNRAPEMQLSELLKSINKGYKGQDNNLNMHLSVLERKRQSPQTIEVEIRKIQDLLEEYRASMQKHADSITKDFTGRDAFYKESLEKITIKHKNEVSKASYNRVRKILDDYQNCLESFVDNLGSKIKSKFEEEVKRRGGEFKTKHSIAVPDFDISSLVDKAKNSAYKYIMKERGPKGFKEWSLKVITLGIKKFQKEVKQFDKERYLECLRKSAFEEMDTIEGEIDKVVSILIGNITPSFKSSLKTLIKVRNEELEKIKTKKEDNKKILEQIGNMKQKKKDISDRLGEVSSMLANFP